MNVAALRRRMLCGIAERVPGTVLTSLPGALVPARQELVCGFEEQIDRFADAYIAVEEIHTKGDRRAV